MTKINRVLISVSDKTGIDKLGRALKSLQCEIISTGGTKKVLESNSVHVIDISNVTGNPEAFGGRMKTISFAIESALLFDRDKDLDEAKRLGIVPIDMVVCNLYPFSKVKQQGANFDTLIENIDIGGPTMIRAAAKNFKFVAVVTDPDDYDHIIDELNQNNGFISIETKKELMRKAFNYTADYDALIADTMDNDAGIISHRFAFTKGKVLRYGENAHQAASFLRQRGTSDSLYDMEVLHGKELSFNNIGDIYAAIEAVRDLPGGGCAIIKHANPCGLATASDQLKAFQLAWAGDTVSAYGSVIAFNGKLTRKTVEFLELDAEDKSKRKFVEVIIAPQIDDDARDYLYLHKNLRVIQFDSNRLNTMSDIKFYFNSILYQTADRSLYDKLEWVTHLKRDIDDDLIKFGIIACRQLKSNSIAAVRRVGGDALQLLGMGCGQPNRVNSTELTLKKCHNNLIAELGSIPDLEKDTLLKRKMADVVLFSDAFFPFSDNVNLSYEYGIQTIVQPGGSIRDAEVIDKCNELHIAMLFTGTRHFKH